MNSPIIKLRILPVIQAAGLQMNWSGQVVFSCRIKTPLLTPVQTGVTTKK